MLKTFSTFNKQLLFAWGLILTFFLPLYPKFPLFFPQGQGVAVRLDDVIVFLALLSLLGDEIRTGFSTLKNPVVKLFVLFFAIFSLATLNGVFIGQDVPITTSMLHLARRAEYFILFLIVIKNLINGYRLSVFITTSVLAFIGVLVYGYGQKLFAWPIISTMNKEFSQGLLLTVTQYTRISSSFAGHYDFATYLSVFLPIVLTLSFIHIKKILRLGLFVLWLAGFYMLILTASRVSFAAHFFGSLLLLGYLKRWFIVPFLLLNILAMFISPELNQRLAASYKYDVLARLDTLTDRFFPAPTPIPVPTTVVVITPTPNKKPQPTTPTPLLTQTPRATSSAEFIWPHESVEQSAYRSSSVRFQVEWPRAWRALSKNPLLGTGPGSVTLATDNDFLRHLAEGGVLGFVGWILPLAYLFLRGIKQLFSKTKSHPLVLAFTVTIIIMFLNATFIDVFEASKVAYFFWGLMAQAYWLFASSHEKTAH